MKRAYRLLSAATLVAGFALSSGCSILPKAEPVDIYRLPVAQGSLTAHTGNTLPWSLRVLSPQAGDTLSSARIAVIAQGDVISNYKDARWSDPAPVLLRNRLLEGFINDGRVQLLGVDDSNVKTDFELGGNLQAFQSEYQGKAVDVVIRLDARLVRGYDQKMLASKRFEVRQPLSATQVPAVVTGFGQAGDVLTRQVVEWAVQQGQRAAPKVSTP